MLYGLEQVCKIENVIKNKFILLKKKIYFFTAIMTAAMEMLGGGEGVADQCRTTDIMADAAYVMLTRYNTSIFFHEISNYFAIKYSY